MTPYGLTQLKFNFREMIKKFGWSIETRTKYHERDDCSWEEDFIVDADKRILCRIRDISERFAEELKRISETYESNNQST